MHVIRRATLASAILTLACGGSGPIRTVDSASALSTRGGGCYLPAMGAAQLGLLSLVNPEWAPVVHGTAPASAPVLAHGTAMDSHMSLVDFPSTHRHFDQNTALKLDPGDAGLLATGNALESSEPVLELEWEAGSYPEWAWAGEGDRVVALGRWIFDCGHPDPTPRGTCSNSGGSCSYDSDCPGAVCVGAGGTCQGASQRCWVDADCTSGRCEGVEVHYRSELHPPQAVAVIRTGRGGVLAGSPVPVTRADIYVSGDGGGAGDGCVLAHRASLQDQIAAACFPLREPIALSGEAGPAIATDFAFDVPLPAGGTGTPRWEFVARDLASGTTSAVTPDVDVTPAPGGSAPHLAVAVRMSRGVGGAMPTAFAATLIAGWSESAPTDLVHVRLIVEGIIVGDPMKPAAADPLLQPPPGWSMQVAVNGEWQQVAGLDAVGSAVSGQTIPVHVAFDQLVPASGSIRLVAQGGSLACANTLMGQALGDDLVLFGLDMQRTAACIADAPRDLGRVDVEWHGPDFGTEAPQPAIVASSTGAYTMAVRVDRLTP